MIPKEIRTPLLLKGLSQDKETLVSIIGQSTDVHFLKSHGNLGDELIFAGTRQLLSSINIPYTETPLSNEELPSGDIALISGGGAWCRTWEDFMTERLPKVKNNFDKVVVLPSSYQISSKVFDAIQTPGVTFMAREEISYMFIRNFCDSVLSHDHAFHLDYSPYYAEGKETLYSYRKDAERAEQIDLPAHNIDTSILPIPLRVWLLILSSYETVYTDRAHVMIASAMLGKTVHYRASNYHKIPAIVDYSLREFPVYPE
jgi:exopolysaccharide biosynthesis predicted pyruvyltransferase EpsI